MDVVSLPDRVDVRPVRYGSYWSLPQELKDEIDAAAPRKGKRATLPYSNCDKYAPITVFEAVVCGVTFRAFSKDELLRRVRLCFSCCLIQYKDDIGIRGNFAKVFFPHLSQPKYILIEQGSYKTADGRVFEVKHGCVESTNAVRA